MLTAIIVDDENKICSLINCLGHWDELGIKVIATCADGEEALELIFNQNPDIVLTDIRMPVYDGLEIIIKTREAGLKTAFIVISGYRQFEYAQKALQYGVIDFLVKPIEEKMLNDALEKAVAEHENRERNTAEQKRMRELLEEKKKMEKEQFWSRMLSTAPVDEEWTIDEQYAGDIFQAALIRTNRAELSMEQSNFHMKVKSICEEQLAGLHDVIFVSKNKEFFILMNYNREALTKVRNNLYYIYRMIEDLYEIFGQFEFTIGLGIPVHSIGEIKKSIMTARIAWKSRIVCRIKDIITYENLKFNSLDNKEVLSEIDAYELKNYCENYSAEEALKIIHKVEENVEPKIPLWPDDIFSIVESLLYSVMLSLPDGNNSQIKGKVEELLECLECSGTVAEMFDRLRFMVKQIIDDSYREKMSRERMPIRLAKEYMIANYMKELTQEQIADVAGVSTVYFSRLFKEAEGKNYIDYLTELRLGAAKKLLATTNDSVKAIAASVGYLNDRHFRKLFKKSIGVRPNDYRKLH